MKKIILIVVGIILVALLGRLGWAYYQVKSEGITSVPDSVSTPVTDTKGFTATVKSMSDITVDYKFTSEELANFKSDMITLNLKYTTSDISAEPAKTQYGKELNGIFLKNLGISDAITKNWGIVFHPEISSILSDIESQYGKFKNIAQPATSDLMVSKVYVISKDIFIEGRGLSRITSEDIDGSTCVYLGNDAGFQTTSTDTKITMTGYARCLPKTKPNYISIAWNSDSGKKQDRFPVGIGQTTSVPVASPTSTTIVNAPTATLTINGAMNLSVKSQDAVTYSGGDKVAYVWSSKNADSFNMTNSVTGCAEAAKESPKTSSVSASGSTPGDSMPPRYIGCTIVTTFTAKNTKTGQQATATATMTVK